MQVMTEADLLIWLLPESDMSSWNSPCRGRHIGCIMNSAGFVLVERESSLESVFTHGPIMPASQFTTSCSTIPLFSSGSDVWTGAM